VTLRATLTLTLAFLAAPLAREAQPAGKVWRAGFLSPASREVALPFLQGLGEGL
jgi:hypothetical protein